jgi:hypothetical protein
MDLLNFSFWSSLPPASRYQVLYKSQTYTGYWSLVACLRRALDSSIPITTPSYWVSCPDADLRHVFRGGTEEMPLLDERIKILREAGRVLEEEFEGEVTHLVEEGGGSAKGLVSLLVERFGWVFEDRSVYEGRECVFLKRAQIFVADLWACFEGESWGSFEDVDCVTMFAGECAFWSPLCVFRAVSAVSAAWEINHSRLTCVRDADYRIPQILTALGILQVSPRLTWHIKEKKQIEPHHRWEVELRGCSIWAVEMLRREILKQFPEGGDGKVGLNAILLDFFLYDLAKEREAAALEKGEELGECHRTRSIRY